MLGDHRRKIDVGERVAVHEDEGARRVRRQPVEEERQRAAGSAGGPQDRHLPRITYAQAVSGAVADDARDRLRQMMKVQNRVGNAGAGQPPEDPLDEWLAGHGHGSLRADE